MKVLDKKRLNVNLSISQFEKLEQYCSENNINMTTAVNLWINSLKIKTEPQIRGQQSFK